MRRSVFIGPLVGIVLCILSAAGAVAETPAVAPAVETVQEGAVPENPVRFEAVWAYLMQGEEAFLPRNSAITDVAYFSAKISTKGELYGVPDARRISGKGMRTHLVVAEVTNQALIYFVLNPTYPLRDKLIADIAAAAAGYDGVVVDFETMRADDGAAFREFLALLKARLPGKILTVCVPARTRAMNDAYEYRAIAAIADKVFVMNYDEHWSGSAAGPVSSIGWTEKVTSWALSTVGPEKLVMGLPFYGRAWGDKSPAGAYKYSSSQRLREEKGSPVERTQEGIPYFSFAENINVVIYFDDALSTARRAASIYGLGVRHIGFWRLGQEDPEIWRTIGIGKR